MNDVVQKLIRKAGKQEGKMMALGNTMDLKTFPAFLFSSFKMFVWFVWFVV